VQPGYAEQAMFDGDAPSFEVSDVSFAYDGQALALQNVSLVVEPGECVAVLGSNGSGKSTLLKILDGLLFPTAGSVRVFGRDLSEQTLRDDAFNYAFRARVAFVFQESEAMLFMPTVWDEVAFGPLQLDVGRENVARRVEDVLNALGIGGLRDRAPHQLSGGEQRRVALASVLGLRPDVWLLDEPSAGLDPRTVSWLVDFIRKQSRANKTIVVATHDLALAREVAGRVVVLDEVHRNVADGPAAEVLADGELLARVNLTAPDRH
jgi:cobalt/nickel transport system ATP-binding protein